MRKEENTLFVSYIQTIFQEVIMANTMFIELGNLTFEGNSGIPTVEIKVEDKVTGYLTPFRGYSFQVSGNKSGDGDHGSSPVIAFYRDVLAGIPKGAALTLLSGQATMALVSHRGAAESSYNGYNSDPEDPNRVTVLVRTLGWNKYTEKWNEFIERSYEWIMR